MTTQRQQLATYALTISTFQQHRHFQRTANAELFLATLQRYRTQGKFLVHAYAVMPDHVHTARPPPTPKHPHRPSLNAHATSSKQNVPSVQPHASSHQRCTSSVFEEHDGDPRLQPY